jgi:2-aminoadipate transaminase
MADTIVFTRGVPPVEAFPTEEINEAFSLALHADAASILQYGHQPGYAPLRSALAKEYNVSDSEIFVASGSLQIQDLIAAYLIKPGDVVYTEQPSYDRAIATFRRRGAKTIGIPLEPDGISIERLKAAIEKQVPAFLYLIPDFQNPAGQTTSYEKRKAIVELAEQYGFWVIEDVPYRKLRYRGDDVPMLRDVSPTRVLTLSSYSKLLSPGMRVGYMVAPQAFTAEITKLAENTYLSPVLPTQAIVAQYLEHGWMQPNIENLKTLYKPRWAAMNDSIAKYLPGVETTAPDGGFFVSVTLPSDANSSNLVARAKEIGLVLTPGQAFFADPDQGEVPNGERFIRLPFCAVTPEQIEEGIKRLASLI